MAAWLTELKNALKEYSTYLDHNPDDHWPFPAYANAFHDIPIHIARDWYTMY